MSPTIQRRLWLRPLSVLFLLVWGATALRAEPPPLPRATQQRVNKAVDDGVRFLYATQGRGSWSADGKHVVGYAALPGLTLLECGESGLEPAVRNAAELVRQMAPKLDTTYEIALSILFLDKLGEGGDRALIEKLAARLIAGQTTTGGWSYRCPILSDQGQRDLIRFLRLLEDQPHFDPDLLVTGSPGGSGPLTGIGSPGEADLLTPGKDSPGLTGSGTPPKSPGLEGSTAPPSSQRSPGESVAVGPDFQSSRVSLPRAGWCIKMGETIREGGKSDGPARADRGGKGDGPAKPPAKKVFIPQWLRRFPVFMDPAKLRLADPDGKGHQIRGTTDNSNTQFATLALWAARRHGVPMKRSLNLLVYRYRTSQNENGSWAYPYRKGGGLAEGAAMTCVGLLGLAVGHGVAHDRDRLDPQAAARRARDPQLVRGLAALSRHVGQPAGRLINLRQPNLYFL